MGVVEGKFPMKAKKVQDSDFDIRKWGFFILFIACMALMLVLFIKPEGRGQAQELIDNARLTNLKAQELALRSNAPNDLANLDLSTGHLEKASAYFIESDFILAAEEAQKSILYSDKIIKRENIGTTFAASVRFDELHGEILVKKQGSSDFERATKNLSLGIGDLVRTTNNSSCRFVHKNGIKTTLGRNGQLKFQEDVELSSSSGVPIAIFLEKGLLQVETQDRGPKEQINVLTPNGKVRVYKSTAALIDFDTTNNEVILKVRYGRVDARSGNRTQVVSNQEGLTFTDDGNPEDPQSLIGAPRLLQPIRGKKFTPNQNGFALVTIRWEAANGASDYHLEVATDPLMINIIEEKRNYAGVRADFQNLRPGQYYWRVTAGDAQGTKGLPTEVYDFVVNETGAIQAKVGKGKAPKLEVTPPLLQGFYAIIKGKTDRGATVKINGELALVDKESGSFNHVLKLLGYGDHVINIVAESSSGTIAYKNVTVTVKD